MKIKTSITQSTEVEVTLPFFRKYTESDGWTYIIGIFNESQSVKITTYRLKYTNITHTEPMHISSEIPKAMEWEEISEEQFLEEHETALRSLSLVPQLTETDKEIEDELNRDDLKDVL